jgi:hypothetical protein
MFIAIKITEKHGSFYEHINVTHITRTSFVNSMNPDAGTKIHLRTGEVLISAYTIDVLSQKIEECWKESALMIMVNIIAEKSKIDFQSENEISNLQSIFVKNVTSDEADE